MSRHHRSHQQKPSSSRHKLEDEMEDSIASIKEQILDIDEMLSDYPEEVNDFLSTARSAMTSLDRLNFFRLPRRLTEQVWMLRILQDMAFHDADNGCLRDVADWVQRKWLRILRDHPDDKDILAGMTHSMSSRDALIIKKDLGDIGCNEHNLHSPQYTTKNLALP